ncbi:MAG: ASCH domain-containing protein, partial [Pseudomonadota bacterium]
MIDIPAKYADAETFKFGDSEWLCEALLALVIAGKKTATCGALRDFEADGEALPVPGRRDIALHWDGRPAVVIETVHVETKPFQEVDADFA